MISTSEMKTFLSEQPAFDDISNMMRGAARFPNKAILKETRKTVALARKFNQEVVKPYALELDGKKQEDHEFLPWEFIQKANEWGFYTMWIPRFFGGKGFNYHSLFFFLEEIASECVALANVIGVHYLGLCAVFCVWNIKVANDIFRKVAEGEKKGEPCLITAATTEPNAGTDCEEPELMDKGRMTCTATKVDGGYLLNGTKIFISNGHVSRWHSVVVYEDTKNPSKSAMVCLVETGSKGFALGRHENKMGQLGCVASELIFEDCFVPDDYVSASYEQIRNLNNGEKGKTHEMLSHFFSTSRIGVAAFGVGAARGAFQTCMKFALETDVNGKRLINHQWAQSLLAEMYKNVASSRLTYVEACYANGLDGMTRPLNVKPLFYYFKYYPFQWFEKIVSYLVSLPAVTWLFRKIQLDWQSEDKLNRTQGWGALAKFMCTDAAHKNSQLALELMGQAGLRHNREAEKIFRDAKLLQIYEGTNQLNRLSLFGAMIGRHHDKVVMFEHET